MTFISPGTVWISAIGSHCRASCSGRGIEALRLHRAHPQHAVVQAICGSGMPEYGFGRCDGHHELVDFRLNGRHDFSPAALADQCRASTPMEIRPHDG